MIYGICTTTGVLITLTQVLLVNRIGIEMHQQYHHSERILQADAGLFQLNLAVQQMKPDITAKSPATSGGMRIEFCIRTFTGFI